MTTAKSIQRRQRRQCRDRDRWSSAANGDLHAPATRHRCDTAGVSRVAGDAGAAEAPEPAQAPRRLGLRRARCQAPRRGVGRQPSPAPRPTARCRRGRHPGPPRTASPSPASIRAHTCAEKSRGPRPGRCPSKRRRCRDLVASSLPSSLELAVPQTSSWPPTPAISKCRPERERLAHLVERVVARGAQHQRLAILRRQRANDACHRCRKSQSASASSCSRPLAGASKGSSSSSATTNCRRRAAIDRRCDSACRQVMASSHVLTLDSPRNPSMCRKARSNASCATSSASSRHPTTASAARTTTCWYRSTRTPNAAWSPALARSTSSASVTGDIDAGGGGVVGKNCRLQIADADCRLQCVD